MGVLRTDERVGSFKPSWGASMMASFVRSADGTDLKLVRAGGGGPTVVLVHGTIGSKADWAPTMPRLIRAFTVVAFDRRGRAESGDGPEYSIEREVDDVLAVVDSCSERPHVVGHSFGAVVSLLAAARAPSRVGKVVLYEPPVGSAPSSDDRWLDALEDASERGDFDTAVELFLAATGATADEVSGSREDERAWHAMRAAVGTVPREIRAAQVVLPQAADIAARVEAPTLVLVGSEQHHPTYSGLRLLAERFPHGRLSYVPGHHLAMLLEPDAFADTVQRFLEGKLKSGAG